MSLGDKIRALFATPAPEAKAASGETGWQDSLLYAKSSWPKYNPDDLIGQKGARVYRKMMQDEQVKAVVRFKRDAITGRRWYFEFDEEDLEDAKKSEGTTNVGEDFATLPPGKEVDNEEPDAEDDDELDDDKKERIRVFEQIIEQMDGSFYDSLNGVLTSMQFGFSISEKVQKEITVNGKTWVGLKRLALKPFETFMFAPDQFGNIRKCIQRYEGYTQDIDMSRFVHYVQNSDVDPHYGQSELREAYRAWFSKDMAIRFWNIHLERHSSGFLKIQPSEGTEIRQGSAEYNTLVSAMSNLSPKSALMLPSGVNAELIHPSNTDAFERAITVHDKAIAKALLVPNLLGISEQGSTGSYSQSQTQLEAFLWTLEAETKRLEEIINEHVFKDLGEINFGSGPYPRFRFKPLSEAVKMNVIKTWNELVKSGAVTATETDETHIRELLDFPEAGETEPPPAMIPGQMPGQSIPGQPAPGQPQAKETPDETVIGKEQIKPKPDMKAAFAKAVKRVDFAVIDNNSAKITQATNNKVTEALKDGAEAIKTFIRENDLFKNPDKIADVGIPARIMTRIKKAAELGLKDAWDLGAMHARKELEKASGTRFAADTMRLTDEAAQKFLEARAYTFAGDLASSTKKKVTTVLYNGIKDGWAMDEILSRIDDELGSQVFPHAATAVRTIIFESVNEARYELFASPEMAGFVEGLEFSAILDGRTTEVCQHMDGRDYKIDNPVWEKYTPPLHFNCRSLLIAITSKDQWTESDPPTIEPMDGFGGG